MTRDEWRQAAAEEEAARDANLDILDRLDAAAAAPGFSGELRRAILAARIRPSELAPQIGVDRETLQRFRLGEGTLPSAAFDRLLQVVGLHLVPVEAGRD